MKQVTQRLRNGRVEVMEVPRPVVAPEGVLVDVRASLLSAGTERSTVEAARRGLIGKARARPEQARQVFEKARREGVRATLQAVQMRLDQPSALGYSSAGVVMEVGARVADLRPGDRVSCAGGCYAVHAELNYVPVNLCARLPESVLFEAGAFAGVGSIALHGVRQAEARIGERAAVIGLGLVGQLTCRILAAAGCNVVGVDVVEDLVNRVRSWGNATGYLRSELELHGLPLDARDCDVIIVTAATGSDDPVRLAGALARDRARVVVVGDVGMAVPRTSYYGKELELRLSRSYGPGRY
jgi:threonine dehydrogenase-like Zn-dependent dehydrogenase